MALPEATSNVSTELAAAPMRASAARAIAPCHVFVPLTLRKAPCGVTLRASGGRAVVANSAVPRVAVRGPVGELSLFVYGRQGAAQVELLGDDDDVAALMAASFGI
jgi:hypothetical protein